MLVPGDSHIVHSCHGILHRISKVQSSFSLIKKNSVQPHQTIHDSADLVFPHGLESRVREHLQALTERPQATPLILGQVFGLQNFGEFFLLPRAFLENGKRSFWDPFSARLLLLMLLLISKFGSFCHAWFFYKDYRFSMQENENNNTSMRVPGRQSLQRPTWKKIKIYLTAVR